MAGVPEVLCRIAALCAAACVVAAAGGPAVAAPIKALTPDDASAYASAFQAAAQGDFDAARQAVADVADKSLVGYIELKQLMSPATTATYTQLRSWLASYGDLPGADRVLQLAKKRRPRGAPAPRIPETFRTSDATSLAPPASAKGLAAREAYYSGDIQAAYRLAVAANERWIAGLCAFRLKKYAEAMGHFQAVAMDASGDPWLRAGAGYWAARSAIAAGSPELAPDFLKIAARSPATFYGMLAERQLGLEPGADPQAVVLARAGFGPSPAPADAELIRTSNIALDLPQLSRLIRTEVRAKRAVALAQIGRMAEAGQELRAGLASANTDAQRRQWTTLALELNASAAPLEKARAPRSFDPDDYPTPDYKPVGGFTLDKALVYAIVRQESRFDPSAVSYAGAIGLMQLMPQTAARAAGDDKLKTDSSPLYDPSTNLRVGQDYLDLLMHQAAEGDVLRTVAAYNGGPGALLRAEQTSGDDDPLLLMESLPAGQTRDYVEKVMANYWIYRRIFGGSSKSIDALASGARATDAKIER